MYLPVCDLNLVLDPSPVAGWFNSNVGHVRLYQWQYTSSSSCNGSLPVSGLIEIRY